MSWVSPIKGQKALHEFEDGLKKPVKKYYVLFEIGLGTGLKMPDILGLRNEDVWEKEVLELNIGKKISAGFSRSLRIFKGKSFFIQKGKDPEAWLFPGVPVPERHLSKERVTRVMKKVGEDVGLPPWRQHHAENLCLELL